LALIGDLKAHEKYRGGSQEGDQKKCDNSGRSGRKIYNSFWVKELVSRTSDTSLRQNRRSWGAKKISIAGVIAG